MGHYEDLPDNDLENPLVLRAYDAAAKVIDRQLQTISIKYEAWADLKDGQWVPREGEPYRNSNAMRADVLRNNHMWFYITDAERFGPPGEDFSHHPLLAQSQFKASNGYPMLQNDVLRVVHDYYAHTTSPVAFGPKGEEAAWRNHMATIDDPWARWAITTETRGQNSWVNFRPGITDEMPLGERGFAPQKAALLPISDTLTGDDYVDLPMHELQRDLTPAQAQGSLPENEYFQPNRGAITFRKGMAPLIRMMADSDPSTIVHESGHAWLEELFRDAAHPNAPLQLQADAATTRAWLGIKQGEAIPRRAHEQWARGFERYLMEGIAPTRELATVFGKFKQWLTRIYQSVAKLRTPINDDVRQVFDRLIASPEQPTIITEPRNTARMMADMHEVEAATTPAHMAGPAADQIITKWKHNCAVWRRRNTMPFLDRNSKAERSKSRTRHLQVASMKPNLSPDQRAVIQQLARSQQASTNLHQQAASFEQQQLKQAQEMGLPPESLGLPSNPSNSVLQGDSPEELTDKNSEEAEED